MTAPGGVIGDRYRLVQQIAVGGMGVVWEAWDELLLRRVAVKQLLTQPDLGDTEVALARNRVIREARITARLHHPHVVTLYDVVDHNGYPCLIMQFVPSTSLSNLLHQQGSLPFTVVTRIGADLAAALVAAHRVGIVHRDIKPGNVLITDDGSAKLTDFGISHAVGDITLTATGMVSGTPAYLAPEVARGAESGYRADVFSLGSTLYAALEGTPPFGTDRNPMAMLHRVGTGRINPPLRSGPLTPLLLRMLAPEPADRPVMTEVAHTLAGRPIQVRTLQDDPPTAVISAQTTRELPSENPEIQSSVNSTPPASAAAESTGRHRPANPTRRHRRPVGAVLVVAAVITAVTLLGFVLLRINESPPVAAGEATSQTPLLGDPPPTTSPASAVGMSPSPPDLAPSRSNAPASVAASTPTISPLVSRPAAQTPPAAVPVPATPEFAAPTTTELQAATTPSSAPLAPTAADLAAAVADYYTLMPDNTDEGWTRLTPAFQTGIAQNRQYYESFWSGIDHILVSDVSGDPPDHAEATISYYFTDGRVAVERTRYQLVQDNGILKLDNSEVLTSRTG